MYDSNLERISIGMHRIELLNPYTATVCPATYRTGPETGVFEKHEIGYMLAENVIHSTQSKWTARITFIRKKDGTIPISVDYHKPNTISKRNSYSNSRSERMYPLARQSSYFLNIRY